MAWGRARFVDMKMDGSVLEENQFFKMLGWDYLCLLNSIEALKLPLLLKLPLRKLGPCLRLLIISIYLSNSLAWNTVVIL